MGLERLKTAFSGIRDYEPYPLPIKQDKPFPDWYDPSPMTDFDLPFIEKSIPDKSSIEFKSNFNKTEQVDLTDLTAERLGFGDLKFDTLYNHNQTSKDGRLNLRQPASGWDMPYIISDIPEEQGWSGGRVTNWGNRSFPMMRGLTDAKRLGKFITSPKGLLFIGKQFGLQFLNPRNKKVWNPLSLLSGIPLGAGIKVRLDRGFGPEYLDTVDGLSSDPQSATLTGMLKSAKKFAENPLDKLFSFTSKYGIKHQVSSPNDKGQTDYARVAPASIDLTNIASNAFNKLIGWGAGEPVTAEKGPYFHPRTKKEIQSFTRQMDGIINKSPQGVKEKILKHIDNNSHIEPPHSEERKSLYSKMTRQKDLTGFASKPYSEINTDPYNAPGQTIQKSLFPESHPFYTYAGLDANRNDKFTTYSTPSDIESFPEYLEASKNGMPFYFQDLRDNTFIVFRAYLEGISENVSPSWASENYIGRSEPVFIYEQAERDISFTLKLVAQTHDELNAIYNKMESLTSLCYPQYQEDVNLGKIRKKPPLVKFRMGELFGSKGKEVTGFIKSLTYDYADTSPWETEQGKRVPKHISAQISFQILHDSVPRLGTKFYGFESE